MADLREHLLAIRDARGSLTPEVVVDEAQDPQHPLHNRFEWDDAVAGHRYRLDQARQLLRVTYRPSPTVAADLRAFVVQAEPSTGTNEWVPLEDVVADPVARQLMLNQMRREMAQLERRWRDMGEFLNELQSTAQRLQGEAG